MKRLAIPLSLLSLAALAVLAAPPVEGPRPRPGQCDPYAEVCRACKDCTACGHCHVKGGKCSVCFKK